MPPPPTPFLTNGFNIIGLLSTPKFIFANVVTGFPAGPYYPANTYFVSNYVTADFRAINDSAMAQGGSQTARDFAFKYRLIPELVPFDPGSYDPDSTNYLAASGLAVARTPIRVTTITMSPGISAAT